MKYDVKDLRLADQGKSSVEWAAMSMPVLNIIRERFRKEKPLRGVRVGACLHVTAETANLAETLQAGGAEVHLCASNPLSTQDPVAAYLVRFKKMAVYAVKGEDTRTYYGHINAVLDARPSLTMDDGADLVSTIHAKRRELIRNILGGTEETTTGVIRLRAMAEKGILRFPLIAVNDARTKFMFDNRYGTGQSTLDGIIRATNRLIAGTNFVVCGYGWCGKGVALRAAGMGANVIVTEVDPLRALEAVMDGHRVIPLSQAAREGDVFCTLTGDVNVIRREHFLKMKDGAIVANSGHFNVELDLEGLEAVSRGKRRVRDYIQEYRLTNGRRVYVLGEGRLINLTAAEGHPPGVMDMSFANQALSAEYLVKKGKTLQNIVYAVPDAIDREIARLKLKSMGVRIDGLTAEQKKYLRSWELGT
ncbi:MAG TPA: adenosylhomocysteinase [Syntrophales bacterium]|nr:adenosylhomocysteinase [Syntrophales bacterium]